MRNLNFQERVLLAICALGIEEILDFQPDVLFIIALALGTHLTQTEGGFIWAPLAWPAPSPTLAAIIIRSSPPL